LKHKKEELPFINEKITASQVQLITHEGENLGVVSRQEALRRATEAELDLVIIAERGGEGVPVVKIMDFGKALYERKKKQAEAKKHQKVIQVKEIKMRPKIGEHDFQTKMKQAAQFLKDGKRVKLTLWFRGRENVLKDQHGSELFERVEKSFSEHGLSGNLSSEKETKLGQIWSRIYFLKNGK
jgi:translation initiation factor IF-3